jgi:hypothetical protein
MEKTLDINLRSTRIDWTLATHRFLDEIASAGFLLAYVETCHWQLSEKVNIQ